nr:immunoglobulin light chain junction region [Macaca mulatta]MOW08616.1 immunoglobulin light chain junction region [Macaca mulatta]MOW10314.1 immunoglobulin light chain junction region [Macaca mulatta]MOW12316.1 immunoglobulin light chain junction region [Macaca mulatta]MOX87491.1 immunoglobulin light chain junction region [Macaca mulatta]
CVQVIAFPYSF